MSITQSVSTMYEAEDRSPMTVTFARTRSRSAPGAYVSDAAADFHFDAGQQQTVSNAIERLIAREDEVFAWLEASEENRSLFARDPEAALRAVIPDFDFTILDELRALAPARRESLTPVPRFESPAATVDAIPFHVATATEMNGWDMIVATRQGIINHGLKALYQPQTIDTTFDAGFPFGEVKVYVKIGTPTVGTLSAGGRVGVVTLPLVEGFLRMKDGKQIDCTGATLTISRSRTRPMRIRPRSPRCC